MERAGSNTIPLGRENDYKYTVSASDGVVVLGLTYYPGDEASALTLEPRPMMDADFAESLAGALKLASMRARDQLAK